jgi:hypothetical protein
MMQPTNTLVAGKAAHQIHAHKTDLVLDLTYKTHVITAPVVRALFGSTPSNAARLLQQLEHKGLLQPVHVHYSEHAPRGNGYMLTPRAFTHVTRNDFEPSHTYNTRPETVRQNQMEHDLVVAQIAATWVRGGGEILQTDFMARQQKKPFGNKIPDLILRGDGGPYAFEYERLTKSNREIDQMMLASMKAIRAPTFWLCGTRGAAMRLQKIIDDREVTSWKLNTANKWTAGQKYFVPFTWRSKQVIFHAPLKEVLTYDVPKWRAMLQDTTARETSRTVQAWINGGWSWSEVRNDLHSDADHGFRLRRNSEDQEIEVTVCFANEQWWVAHPDESFDRGLELKGRTEPAQELGKVPPVALIESAIRAIQSNPDFFQ